MLANAAVKAPYADIPIPLYLSSTTGMRYRSLNCLECGDEFLERNNDTMYRINDPNLPTEIAISSLSVKAMCGNCKQWYGVQISLSVTVVADSIPLYLQPESMYITSETSKKLRYVHCLECGHAFQNVSDRISQVIDNRIPFEYLNPGKLGPLERTCTSGKCGQVWAVMI